MLGAIPREASLLTHLRRSFPSVRDVHLTRGGVCRYHLNVQIKKRWEGEAKNVMFGAFAGHADIKRVVVVDQDLPDNYARVHIPGAVVYQDHYFKELSNTPHIQDAKTFALTMESLGIGDNTTVIAYDSDGNHVAARLFWALKYYGHEDVKVLDGGFPKWLAEGKPLSRDNPRGRYFHIQTAGQCVLG